MTYVFRNSSYNGPGYNFLVFTFVYFFAALGRYLNRLHDSDIKWLSDFQKMYNNY